MFTRLFITTTLLVLATPAMAWACTSTPVANPVDYLVFGVSAGLFYRLFLQQRLEASEDFHSAVYLSLLVASCGVGAMVAQESTLQNGYFGVFGIVLATLGSLSPKLVALRQFVLVPVLVSAAILSVFVVLGEDVSRCTHEPTWTHLASRRELPVATPFDFVVLGIAAAAAFRLFGPESRRTRAVESAIYIGFMVASFVLGALIIGRFNFDTGYFKLIPAVLAVVGALYPKRLVFRASVLGPLIIVSGLLSLFILSADHSPERFVEFRGCGLDF